STGWPRIGRMCSPTIRITMSVALPGPNGTTTLMGFEGYLSCAGAGAAPNARKTTPAARSPKRLIPCSRSRDRRPLGVLLRHLDFHLGGDLAPGGELAVEPGLRLLERCVRLDADELLGERLLQRRGLRRLADRLEQRRQHVLRRIGRRQHALPVQRA